MLSDARRLRLTQQAMVTVKMLQRIYDGGYRSQTKLEGALLISDIAKTADELSRKKPFLESLDEVFLEAPPVRLDNTLDMVAKKEVEDLRIEKPASTILYW